MADGFSKGLLVVLYVGAANADATAQQRARLKAEVLPTIKDPQTPPSEAMAQAVRLTAQIMGPDWQPKGEWDDWITSLLGGK